MDRGRWQEVIQILQSHNVKTVIAVIPSVRDKLICSEDYDIKFWENVKKWNDFGHKIAMHGVSHLIENRDDCWQATWKRGERLGNDENEIISCINEGKSIFKKYWINIDSYVPPAHGLSKLEIKCLKKSGILHIFDGFSFYASSVYGVKIYPQFIWSTKDYRPQFETFICLHPCTMSEKEIKNLNDFLSKNENLVASWDQFNLNEKSLFTYMASNKLLKIIRKARNVLRG